MNLTSSQDHSLTESSLMALVAAYILLDLVIVFCKGQGN